MSTSATRRVAASISLLLLTWGGGTSGARPAPQAAAPAADVLPVLLKASDYVAAYVKALSSVVSEERYEQVLARKGDRYTAPITLSRTLLSDYLLVAVAGSGGWMPFRDVYSVDGVPVRDRNDRLLKLFVEAPADAYRQALRIRDESSRYNLGSDVRDINVPTFALQVLDGEWRGGFTFKPRGREQTGDTDAAVVDFTEVGTPTLVADQAGKNVPARGRLWIDPADGRVLRTLFETRPFGVTNAIEVSFRYEPRMELLVPGVMIEHRRTGLETLDGKATYSNFRRFRVDTSMEIKK